MLPCPGGPLQRRASWYFLLFQLSQAEELLQANDWAVMREVLGSDTDLYIPALSQPGALTAGQCLLPCEPGSNDMAVFCMQPHAYSAGRVMVSPAAAVGSLAD